VLVKLFFDGNGSQIYMKNTIDKVLPFFRKAGGIRTVKLDVHREILEVITGRPLPKKIMSVAEIDKKRIPLPFPLDNHLIYSGDLIQQVLNFTYMSLTDGMQRTYDWYCKEL